MNLHSALEQDLAAALVADRRAHPLDRSRRSGSATAPVGVPSGLPIVGAAVGGSAMGGSAVGGSAVGGSAVGGSAVGSSAVGSSAVGSSAVGSTAVLWRLLRHPIAALHGRPAAARPAVTGPVGCAA